MNIAISGVGIKSEPLSTEKLNIIKWMVFTNAPYIKFALELSISVRKVADNAWVVRQVKCQENATNYTHAAYSYVISSKKN